MYDVADVQSSCSCRVARGVGVRFGAKVDNYGEQVTRYGIAEPTMACEAAGFDSVWLSDHVVMPSRTNSPFPFSDDGQAHWRPEDPWFDPVTCLGFLGALTQRVELAVGVLIGTLRQPVVVAKEIATVDRLTSGRVVLGVGAGWLAEEFEALGVPFAARGERLDEWIRLVRACWTGRPGAMAGRFYTLPPGVLCYPVPARPVPVLVGGTSSAALTRAALVGDGWVPLLRPCDTVTTVVGEGLARIREIAAGAGRDLTGWRCVYNADTPERVAPLLPDLEVLGVTDVVVEVDYSAADGAMTALALLRENVRGD